MTQKCPDDEEREGRHRRDDDDLDAPTVNMRPSSSALARWSGRSTEELKIVGTVAAIMMVLAVGYGVSQIDWPESPEPPTPDTYGDFNRGRDAARYYLGQGDSRDLAYLMCEDDVRATLPSTDTPQWLNGCRRAVQTWKDSDWEYGYPTQGD